jgi:hypothetical protein
MDAWKATRDKSYIFGQFLWTGIDYLGEAGGWPSRGSTAGLLDLGGFKKPRGYFRQALWDSNPMVYIGTYPATRSRRSSMDAWPVWNYNPGDEVRVVCYTNCRQARLLLNGQEAGELKPYDDQTGVISWTVPFQAGKLEVIGLNDQQEVCRYAIQTAGKPFALSATTDHKTLSKDNELVHVTIQVVDEQGLPVLLSEDTITCSIEGPAKLLGLESGNMTDMGNYRDDVQQVFHGRTLAYIQTTGTSGEVTVTFSAPSLKPVNVQLHIN